MKHGHNDEPRRIVIGVDGFESSKAALRWAIHQAKLTGAVVDAVTAWHHAPCPVVIMRGKHEG
jgi:hypothetical protein